MCKEFGWDREDDARENTHNDFKDALVQQFNHIYGTNQDDLASWRTLCQIVHVSPIPDTLKSCREVEAQLVFICVKLTSLHNRQLRPVMSILST